MMKHQKYNVAILGASGLVGKELFSLLFERNFPLQQLFLLGSSSVGSSFVDPAGASHVVVPVENFSWEKVDFLFSCVENAVAGKWIPAALQQEVTVIDNSSLYRLQNSVPLIIPEINGSKLSADTRLVANPNCVAAILSMGIFPVARKVGILQGVASTYQAMSGGGGELLLQFLDQTQKCLQNNGIVGNYPHAFNLYPHESPVLEDGYCEEEFKIMQECNKILNTFSFPLSPFCVRVPVLRAHSIHLSFTVKTPTSVEEIISFYQNFPGVVYCAEKIPPFRATPNAASGKDAVFVSNVRKDKHRENTFDIWMVGDQLRKGAALNALQIVERLLFLRGGGI